MGVEQISDAVVFVVDGGGRGGALAEAYADSEKVTKVIVIPGSDFLTHPTKPIISHTSLKTTDIPEIVRMCAEEQKTHTVLIDVAQDRAVATGLANATREAGIPTVGPTKEAGSIESDKAWSRKFMEEVGILQPEYHIFTSPSDGIAFLQTHPDQKWFVKASGLAEGKGALPAKTNQEAIERIAELQKFQSAADTYLLEEWLEGDNGEPGEEFSAFAFCDGHDWQLVGYAQDHKRALDGDKGENTGGMGCSTPPQVVDASIDAQTREIFSRIFLGLQNHEIPYQGVLYFGGMIVKRNGKPTVYAVECNARWGDPEAQVIVPSIENDFFTLNMAIATGELGTQHIQTDGKTRVSVAVAAVGYPGEYTDVKGRKVNGLDEAGQIPGIHQYGAGLRRDGDSFVVSGGGRIVHEVAEGETTTEANILANQAADLIKVEGDHGENLTYHRSDIGWRDIQRALKSPS